MQDGCCSLLPVLGILLVATVVGAQLSLTNAGSPDARLSDWSWAGYGGNAIIPSYPVVTDVTDFGARPNGLSDAAPAFQAAINFAKSRGGGTVRVPAGKFLIGKRVTIDSSRIVLKGAGTTRTILTIKTSLSGLDRRRPFDYTTGQSPYSWEDAFLRIKGKRTFGSRTPDSMVARVVKAKTRGYTQLVVDDASNIKPGMWLRLCMSDPYSGPYAGSLASKLYGGEVEDSSCGKNCLRGLQGEVDLVRWLNKVVRVQGNTITFARKIPLDVRPEWRAQLHLIPQSTPVKSGIQDLAIHFAVIPVSEHLRERGRNAIVVENAKDVWVSNIRINNADNGVVVRYSDFVTVQSVVLGVTADRSIPGGASIQGHIGLGVYNSADVLFSKFRVNTRMWHDTSVRGGILCVFHSGIGLNLNMDSHRAAPYATLYTNMSLGQGTRPFTSGGSIKMGFPAASYTTYWNVRKSNGQPIVVPSNTVQGECTWGSQINFKGNFQEDPCLSYYFDYASVVYPSNLFSYQSQKIRRLTGRSAVADLPVVAAEAQQLAEQQALPEILPAEQQPELPASV